MEIEKFIINNVKLFTNKSYFKTFCIILTNLSKNFSFYQKYNSLFKSKDYKDKKIIQKKNIHISNWFIIMKIILNKLESKEKELFENNLKLNGLVFSYLVKLCKIKAHKLYKLSIKERVSLNNLLLLYFDLCEKAIYPEQFNNKENNKKVKKLSLDNSNKYNICQTTRIHSASKSKIFKSNNNKNSLFLNDNNNKENSKVEEEDENSENNVKIKYGLGKIKITFLNSLSRLFIGKIDEKSVKEKYLMNITIKKDQKIKFHGENMSKVESYSRGLMNEINKEKGKYRGIIIDQNLAKIIDKYHKEQKILEEYKKSLNQKETYLLTKKLKKNIKFNKTIQIFDSNSPKSLHNSASCVNFSTLCKTDNYRKNINNNKIIFYRNKDYYGKKILFDKNNHYKIGAKKIKLERAYSNSNIYKRDKKLKGKIAKFLISKFKEYKNIYTRERKTEYQNYMSKRDFFYNDEFIY